MPVVPDGCRMAVTVTVSCARTVATATLMSKSVKQSLQARSCPVNSRDSLVRTVVSWPRTGRALLLIDAAAEAGVAILLVVLSRVDTDAGPWRTPTWLSSDVLVAVAVVFAVTAVAFVILVRHIDRTQSPRPVVILVPLGVVNVVAAAVVVAWAVVDGGVGAGLTRVIVVVGVVVGVLGLSEVAVARGKSG